MRRVSFQNPTPPLLTTFLREIPIKMSACRGVTQRGCGATSQTFSSVVNDAEDGSVAGSRAITPFSCVQPPDACLEKPSVGVAQLLVVVRHSVTKF